MDSRPVDTLVAPDKQGIDENNGKKAKKESERNFLQKKFNQAVYGGISYAAQAMTIGVTYWLAYGQGKPLFERAVKWFGSDVIHKYTGMAEQKALILRMLQSKYYGECWQHLHSASQMARR